MFIIVACAARSAPQNWSWTIRSRDIASNARYAEGRQMLHEQRSFAARNRMFKNCRG